MHFSRNRVSNFKTIIDLVSKKEFLIFLYDNPGSWDDEEIRIYQPRELYELYDRDVKPKWELDGKPCSLTIATGKAWAYLTFGNCN